MIGLFHESKSNKYIAILIGKKVLLYLALFLFYSSKDYKMRIFCLHLHVNMFTLVTVCISSCSLLMEQICSSFLYICSYSENVSIRKIINLCSIVNRPLSRHFVNIAIGGTCQCMIFDSFNVWRWFAKELQILDLQLKSMAVLFWKKVKQEYRFRKEVSLKYWFLDKTNFEQRRI